MTHDVASACHVLHQGGLILYPSDTLWGIGCDATQPNAVQRLYDLKQRPPHKPLLVLIDSPHKLLRYVHHVPRIAFQLLRVTSTPLTLVLPHAKNLAPQLLPSNRSLGIRVTREPFSHALCRAFGKPIVSSSANISGQPTPTRFALISPLISTGVDFIVSCRQNDPAPAAPSSIIQFLPDGSFAIIR